MIIKETALFLLLMMIPVAMEAKEPKIPGGSIEKSFASSPTKENDAGDDKGLREEMKEDIKEIKNLVRQKRFRKNRKMVLKLLDDLAAKVEDCGEPCKELEVPDPVALFPLNATYGTKETKNRVAQGIPSGVKLASGPDGKADGSYEFSGTSNSFIEFPNSAGGPLDVQHSMTMLCWVYHNGQDGPLFNYRTSGSWGVHLWVVNGQLFVRFTRRNYSWTTYLNHTPLAGGWKFVGASYDSDSGDAKLWVNGTVVQTLNIGAGLDLATQDPVRMGVKTGDGRYFKGRITQMQVYNKALCEDQIQTIQRRTHVVVFALFLLLFLCHVHGKGR